MKLPLAWGMAAKCHLLVRAMTLSQEHLRVLSLAVASKPGFLAQKGYGGLYYIAANNEQPPRWRLRSSFQLREWFRNDHLQLRGKLHVLNT